LTWQIFARVDDATYALFGSPTPPSGVLSARTTSASYTSTHTYFTLVAGDVTFTLDFFSPVTPQDLVDQSLPFSFFTVKASTTSTANVQILTGIDGTWLGGVSYHQAALLSHGRSYDVSHSASSTATYVSFSNRSAISFTQKQNMATWGSIELAAIGSASQISAANGVPSQLLQTFVRSGAAGHSLDSSLQPDQMISLSYNMGQVQGSESATFAIGNFRNQSILYTATDTSALSGYFSTLYPTLDSALTYFLNQYQRLYAGSIALDAKVRGAASAVSANLADMVEATVRQAYGTTEVVYDHDSPNEPMAFLKEISSNGDCNSLDVISPTMPIYLFLSPSWIKYHLQPYVNYIESGRWTNNFIPHDNGVYPVAHGPGSENMPLQNTATWMSMLWAYNKATNGADVAWIQSQKKFLAPMAAHLLTLANATTLQLATVDWANSHKNQSSLAIQGAQALKIYGTLFNEPSYVSAGASLSEQLYVGGLGMNKDRTHFTYLYGHDDSWNVQGPGMFMDRALGLNTMPNTAWDLEEEWYARKATPLGLPYIGGFATTGDECNPHGGNLVITEWTMWAVAGMRNSTLRRQLIDGTYAFFSNQKNDVPWPTRYCSAGASAGVWQLCRARSTVGSLFAPLISF
jgi:hypothetical protein